jgi:hypothetical protein
VLLKPVFIQTTEQIDLSLPTPTRLIRNLFFLLSRIQFNKKARLSLAAKKTSKSLFKKFPMGSFSGAADLLPRDRV